MPGGDGTGPMGLGPMTGGGRGYCAVPLFDTSVRPSVFLRGFFGRGRGCRHWYRATGLPGWARAAYGLPAFGGWTPELAPKEEVGMLKKQAEFLKQQLEDIHSRIETLGKTQT